jgi:hypothetical protein
MRPDMNRVVTERPRAGPRLKDRKGESKKYQKEMSGEFDSPRKEKIREKWRKHYNDGKRFTDVLGPLYGYLLKQVGRHWDDVYSEICEHLPANTNQGSHIRDHVWGFVEKDVMMFGGIPHQRNLYGWKRSEQYEWSPLRNYSKRPYALYIHPDTGILSKWKEPAQKKEKKKKTLGDILKTSLEAYVKKDGVWYFVEFKEYEFSCKVPGVYKKNFLGVPEQVYENRYKKDALQGTLIAGGDASRLYGRSIYCFRKRSANSNEIKKLKVI